MRISKKVFDVDHSRLPKSTLLIPLKEFLICKKTFENKKSHLLADQGANLLAALVWHF